MQSWLDRKRIKPKLEGALASGKNIHIVLASDVEVRHVTRWLADYAAAKSMSFVCTEKDCGYELRSCEIMSEIAHGIGKEYFTELFSVVDADIEELKARVYPKVNLSQAVGEGAKSLVGNEFKGVTQSQSVVINEVAAIGREGILEVLAQGVTSHFFCGLKKLKDQKFIVVICFYGKGGLSSGASDKFRGWFCDDFIRRVNGFGWLQVCVVDQSSDIQQFDRFDFVSCQVPEYVQEPECIDVFSQYTDERTTDLLATINDIYGVTSLAYRDFLSVFEKISMSGKGEV